MGSFGSDDPSQPNQRKNQTNNEMLRNEGTQKVLHVHGISVPFPFVPYKQQNDLMAALVQAMQHAQNALIESYD